MRYCFLLLSAVVFGAAVSGGCRKETFVDSAPLSSAQESSLESNDDNGGIYVRYKSVIGEMEGLAKITDRDLRRRFVEFCYYDTFDEGKILYQNYLSEKSKESWKALKVYDADGYANFPTDISASRCDAVVEYKRISDDEAIIVIKNTACSEGVWYDNVSEYLFVKEKDGWKFDGRKGGLDSTEITDPDRINRIQQEFGEYSARRKELSGQGQ